MKESSAARVLLIIMGVMTTTTSAQYFRYPPPPPPRSPSIPFYSPMTSYHFQPSDGLSPVVMATEYEHPYRGGGSGGMVAAAASPAGGGPGYGYAYRQFMTGGHRGQGHFEEAPAIQPQPFARGYAGLQGSHGLGHGGGYHELEDAPPAPQYYGLGYGHGGHGQGHGGHGGQIIESASPSSYYGHQSHHPPSYSKLKHVIQPHIHREHVHVHNIYKVSPQQPHQQLFMHNIHHHNVKKEHIHQPVYHKTEKHVHSDSESHKNKYQVKEYNKHNKPQTQETHKWLKPIYADGGSGWGKSGAAVGSLGSGAVSASDGVY